MFTSSTATNLAQQHHHLPNQTFGNSHANQQQQLSHQPQHGNQQISIGQNFASQPLFSLAHQNHLAHQQAPEFLDTNQHLVAQFSHQTAALTNSHFADGLSVADASQFVSVMQQQQQQSQHLQNGGVFNPAAFFQQHHSSNPTSSQHIQSNHSSHQQQLACANVMSTNTASVDNLNLATASQVILDSTGNGLLRLHNGASDQPSLVANSVSDLRQQPRVPASSSNSGRSDCTSSNNNPSNSIGSNFNASKLMSNHCSSINSNTNNNSSITTSNNTNDNNNYTSNTKSSSKSKSNGNNKKDKSESKRDSESPRRTFACPTCGKSFTEKFNMKRHMQIHSQSRPKHVCNECLKSFAWKDNFIRHRKAAHGNNIQQYQI